MRPKMIYYKLTTATDTYYTSKECWEAGKVTVDGLLSAELISDQEFKRQNTNRAVVITCDLTAE